MSADTQLASGHAAALWLLEFRFLGGTTRATHWNHNLIWQSQTWLGLSLIVNLRRAVETEDLSWPAMEVGLNLANPALLALARGPANEYRGRELVAYLCVLDDELRVIDEPEEPYGVWLMDQISLTTGDGNQTPPAVSLRCEVPGRDSRAAQNLRVNDAQQQARYPGDTGLSRMETLVGKPVPWLSVKFQQQ